MIKEIQLHYTPLTQDMNAEVGIPIQGTERDLALIVPAKPTTSSLFTWQLLERWIRDQDTLDIPELVGKVIEKGGSVVQCASHSCESTLKICRRFLDEGFLNYSPSCEPELEE